MRNQDGFTLTELLIIMGLFAVFAAFATINLVRPQTKASAASTITGILSDINVQQLKAMVGSTEATTVKSAYGIYFTATNYTLFKGSTYNSADTTNYTVTLDPSINFTNITFSGSQLIFLSISGEISGYTDPTNTITVTNVVNSETKILQVNRYGVANVQ